MQEFKQWTLTKLSARNQTLKIAKFFKVIQHNPYLDIVLETKIIFYLKINIEEKDFPSFLFYLKKLCIFIHKFNFSNFSTIVAENLCILQQIMLAPRCQQSCCKIYNLLSVNFFESEESRFVIGPVVHLT